MAHTSGVPNVENPRSEPSDVRPAARGASIEASRRSRRSTGERSRTASCRSPYALLHPASTVADSEARYAESTVPTVPEYAVLFLAIGMAGGVATTFSPLYTVAELTHQLRDSGAQLVFTLRSCCR